ncbi:MAG: hypothetical protein ABWY49_10435 [Rhizobium sp.]
MSLSDTGIADSDEISRQNRGAMPRVMASLIVAFFAYLGLALGGGFGTLASTETNNFSAAKGSQQPHYLTVRDTTRGIVIADRDVEPKASWHDGNAAPLAPPVIIAFSTSDAAPLAPPAALPIRLQDVGAYLARGPPAAFA